MWPLLNPPSLWPGYDSNSANVRFQDGQGPELREGAQFSFESFGFPVEVRGVEYVASVIGQPARVAWHSWAGEGDARLDVHHAWLIEDLSGDRARILTQETQNGLPAIELAKAKPNPMVNGHQDWLQGLVSAAFKEKGQKS